MEPLASARPNQPEVLVRWDCRENRVIPDTTFVHTTISKSTEFNKTQCFLKFMGIVAKITLLRVKEIHNKKQKNGGNLY